MHTTGLASDGETWTKSNDDSFAASKALTMGTMPFFSPLASTSRTSLALMLSLSGTIFFFKGAMSNSFYEMFYLMFWALVKWSTKLDK